MQNRKIASGRAVARHRTETMRGALGAAVAMCTITSFPVLVQNTVIEPGEMETATVTIRRIDAGQRFLVLRGADGSEMGIFAPPEFTRFNELRVGDAVTITYYGISEDFVDRVGTMIQPGDSAIFALLRTIDSDLVAAQFKGYGGTILRATLNPEQRAKVEATLHSR